jgi:hypothetical protein
MYVCGYFAQINPRQLAVWFFKHLKQRQIKPLLVADFKMEVNKA